MERLEYKLTFVTPAFLGNAGQRAQWRTPPFKALLRQWWRVAYAAKHGFNVNIEEMRREEGLLFGNAWLSREENGRKVADHCKSQIRIRLLPMPDSRQEPWAMGTQNGTTPMQMHIGTSYAWFGLVRRGPGLPDRTAIKANSTEGERLLQVHTPPRHIPVLQETLRLIDAFGQVGSRSRGGWGSFRILGLKPLEVGEMTRYTQPLAKCLDRDWPVSFSADSKGICLWQSRRNFRSWAKAMETLAAERRTIRTSLRNVEGGDARIALGFAGQGRMPSPLRWKVFGNDSDKLVIRVFAMPHKLPVASDKTMDREKLIRAWRSVIETFDRSGSFVRQVDRGGKAS